MQLTGERSLRGAPDVETRRIAASLMGGARTERKAASSRENGKKAPPGPGMAPRPLPGIRCTCEASHSLAGHKWNCPRGQAIKRRIRDGRDPHTGKFLEAAQ